MPVANTVCAVKVRIYSACAWTRVYCGLSVALDYSVMLNLAYGEFSMSRCSLCWSVVINLFHLLLSFTGGKSSFCFILCLGVSYAFMLMPGFFFLHFNIMKCNSTGRPLLQCCGGPGSFTHLVNGALLIFNPYNRSPEIRSQNHHWKYRTIVKR